MNFAKLLFSFVAVLLLSSVVEAQDEKPDVWVGVLDAKVMKLNVRFEISKDEDGKPTGAMFSPDQTEQAFPFDELVYDDEKFEFKVNLMGAKFKGKLNDNKDEITGEFSQGGGKFPLTLKKSDNAVVDIGPLTQRWRGDMKVGAKTLKFQFRVFETNAGERTVKLDSLTEGIRGMKCEMEIDGRNVTINIPTPGAPAVFTGEINDEHDTVTGEWAQGGGKFPLVIKSVGLDEEPPKRPQTPSPPFSYDIEEVTFENVKGKAKLVGSLTLPKGAGPFPAVILINGTGAHDRDETIFGHKPFWVIADYFTKKGIAVLRYDERGVGKSKGDFANATSVELAVDAECGINFLQEHSRIDKSKVGIVGHSEGGMIATMISSRRPDIAAVVMLAGPAIDGRTTIYDQSRVIAKKSGATEKMLEAQDVLLKRIMEGYKLPNGFDEDFKKKLVEEMGDALPNTEQLVETTVLKFDNPGMKFFVDYDPKESLLKTKCPIYALFGEKDLQVSAKLNSEAIKGLGERANIEMVTYAELNHLFQNCETGSPAEYGSIEETIDEKVLSNAAEWLNKQFTK